MNSIGVSRSETPQCERVATGPPDRGVRTYIDARPRRHISTLNTQRRQGPVMIQFKREMCGDLEAALRREWLETNGLGGYASSTIIGLNTRRYHGLLVAATKPRVGRLSPLQARRGSVYRRYAFRSIGQPASGCLFSRKDSAISNSFASARRRSLRMK
jgi:Glycogen debranching enzyme N terminal